MALDTRAKRIAVTGLGVGGFGGRVLPIPSGSIDSTARATLLGIPLFAEAANTPPIILDQVFYVRDLAGPGLATASPLATDADSDPLTWSITAGNTNSDWAIDVNTGVLTNANTLNRAVTSSYVLTIEVSDGTDTDTAAITLIVVTIAVEVFVGRLRIAGRL